MAVAIVGMLLAPVSGAVTSSASAADAQVKPIVSGWFGWWASDHSVNSLVTQSGGSVDDVNMLWWTFGGPENPLCTYDNGDYNDNNRWGDCLTGPEEPYTTPTPWTTDKFDHQRDALQAGGVRVLATLTQYSRELQADAAAYLDDSAREYADQITDWASEAGVDGVHLDWLRLFPEDDTAAWPAITKNWTSFVSELGRSLKGEELLLSVALPLWLTADVRDSPYRWRTIAPHVDRLRIIAYDYNYADPGPIGPNDWAENVVIDAVAYVGAAQAHKIWIGVPQYGRNWIRRSGDYYVTVGACPTGWTPDADQLRLTVTPQRALDLAAREGVSPSWDATFSEWSFRYRSPTEGKVLGKKATCTVEREVWFADTQSAVARASLVNRHGIGGIAVWDFGSVQPDFYPKLSAFAREASDPFFTLRAPTTARAGKVITLRAQFVFDGVLQASRRTSLWWSRTEAGQRTKIATKATSGTGSVEYKARATSTGFWWITTTTRFGFEWTAGPTAVRVRR